MKYALILVSILLASCGSFPVSGEITYTTPKGDVKLSSQGKGVVVDVNVKGQ